MKNGRSGMESPQQNKIEERFDRESRTWREMYFQSERSRWRYHDKLYRKRYVLEMLGKGNGLALDLGCGAGMFFEDLRKAGYQVMGADFSAEMVKLASQAANGCTVVRADAVHLPFARNAFTALIGVGLLEYLPDDDPLLREILRVVKPKGAIVITLRNQRCVERRLWDAYARMGLMKRRAAGFYREHRIRAFQAKVRSLGFAHFQYRFCHFYPLPWPFSKFLGRLNNILAHGWERIFSRSKIEFLGSTIICRFTAPSKE